jgi:hypothetical protein
MWLSHSIQVWAQKQTKASAAQSFKGKKMHCDQVFKTFIEKVIKAGVFSRDELSRDAEALSDKVQKEIEVGKRIDRRAPWLSRISGKGGPGYPEWENASLMEHLVSVARGAVVFAEIDLLESQPHIETSSLVKRLARITVTGFLHDIDKILVRDRSDEITAKDVSEVIERFRINDFLREFDAEAPAEWFLTMIDRAETSRSGRILPEGLMLTVTDTADAQYVHLADRMDSILLKDGPKAALKELEKFSALRSDAVNSGWQLIDINQPLFPFLLDALLTEIAEATKQVSGLPPLLETHHDGCMIAAIPEKHADVIMDTALAGVQERFRGKVRVTVNNRCSIDIKDAPATIETLFEAMSDARLRQRTFALSTEIITSNPVLQQVIEDAAQSVKFSLSWPNFEKINGATFSPFPTNDEPENIEAFKHGSVLSIALRCAQPKDKELAKSTMTSLQRETRLREILEDLQVTIPDEISCLDHEITRQSIVALLVGGLAASDEEVFEAIFGKVGIIQGWFDGCSEYTGINARIDGDVSASYIAPVREMVRTSMDGHFIEVDESAPYRCHFTNRPVQAEDIFASKGEGIYGLKISAFSGRENRPENHRRVSAKGTWISPLARAEHNLRFRMQPRSTDKTQLLISSPATTGLFASLTIGNIHNEIEVSAFEACAEDVKKVRVPTIGVDRFSRRLRVARYETMESSLKETLDLLIRLLKTSIRTCRPLHVFQGLPHPVKDRVYFDSLPREIERGLEKKGFRIEELPGVLHRLETWQAVAQVNGLGVRLATEIMDPKTRLAALCEAVLRIERMNSADLSSLKGTLSNQIKDMIMQDMENPLIRYAAAMTGYQRATFSGPNGDSQAVRERGMRKAIDAVTRAYGLGPLTRETIISAVVAEISNAADRESTHHFPKRNEGEPSHAEALTRAAEIFADEIWPQVFQGRLPDSRTKIHAIGVYRAAFDRAHQKRRAGEIVFPFT